MSFCIAAGVIALPVFAIALAAVAIEDGRPVLFRQQRIGRGGRPFELLKIRSMGAGTGGPMLTARGDCRITRVGRFLRRYKLDELPQLWNVIRGEMGIVGPRPEVPMYVVASNPVWQRILQGRPGLTDLATLIYRNEEAELARFADPDVHYRHVILPAKLSLNLEYLRRSTPLRDLQLIALTIVSSFFPSGFDPDKLRRAFLGPESRTDCA